MVGIYKITNPEGKSYIGLSKDIEKRFKGHKGLQFHGNNKLRESLTKYGGDSHLFEILEEVNILYLDRSEGNALLRKRERYWINLYKTFENGLNENKGGSGCGSHTEESKQKISQALKGKPKPLDFGAKRSKDFYTDEWKNKLSEASKGISRGKGISKNKGRVSPNKGVIGKTRTEETKKQIGIKNSQTQLSKSKPIFQYDKLNNFIQEFTSQKLALEYLDKKGRSDISDCLNMKRKSAFGFIWKYKI